MTTTRSYKDKALHAEALFSFENGGTYEYRSVTDQTHVTTIKISVAMDVLSMQKS